MTSPTCSAASLNRRAKFKPYATAEPAIATTPENNSDPLEEAIAEELWRWAFASEEIRSEMTTIRMVVSPEDVPRTPRLPTMLEFYLCGVFQLVDYTHSRNIWCDGILEFSIERTTRKSFLIVAAIYCPNVLAPVEIEFHYPVRRSCRATRIIVRFNDPGEVGTSRIPSNVILRRPQHDRDWTVAVELTDFES
ncbi:MAG: hypothetical protein ACI92S_001953 [Planctomycetaceae bacterium]